MTTNHSAQRWGQCSTSDSYESHSRLHCRDLLISSQALDLVWCDPYIHGFTRGGRAHHVAFAHPWISSQTSGELQME